MMLYFLTVVLSSGDGTRQDSRVSTRFRLSEPQTLIVPVSRRALPMAASGNLEAVPDMLGRNRLREKHNDHDDGFWSRHPRLRIASGVFIGGVIGTAVRAALSEMQSSDWVWPWVTFCINMVGAMLLGFLLEYLARTGDDVGIRQSFRLFVGTGIIGGFTTYGTFILETDTRFMDAHMLAGLSYGVTSILLGLVFAACGVMLAERCASRSNRKAGEGR